MFVDLSGEKRGLLEMWRSKKKKITKNNKGYAAYNDINLKKKVYEFNSIKYGITKSFFGLHKNIYIFKIIIIN